MQVVRNVVQLLLQAGYEKNKHSRIRFIANCLPLFSESQSLSAGGTFGSQPLEPHLIAAVPPAVRRTSSHKT